MTTHEDTGRPPAPPVAGKRALRAQRKADRTARDVATGAVRGGRRRATSTKAEPDGRTTHLVAQAAGVSWWHRAHPVFDRLAGFFTGLVVLVVVPSVFAGLLSHFLSYDDARQYFPYLALILVVPIVLLAVPRTRRFGLFMLIGMLATALVVVVSGAATLYLLLRS